MRARAVIGANYGDEGKGLFVDYLCATEGAGIVVRYNGGAQAGHTVVTPQGVRHVFSHFGSGTLAGVPTYLSRFFVCNPILFYQERQRLPRPARVYASPECLVTTYADMFVNQEIERLREGRRHGSCGVGFCETIERSKKIPLTMRDLWDDFSGVERTVEQIVEYAQQRLPGMTIEISEEFRADFLRKCSFMANSIDPAYSVKEFRDPILEGAQGLMLCQSRMELFPHLTRSYTGMCNVRQLCAEANIEQIDAYYVSRTYLTRHGAGPLPGEDPDLSYPDSTNVDHPFQGRIRFAPLDTSELLRRIEHDHGGGEPWLVLTHCDQRDPTIPADFYSYGEHRELVTRGSYRARTASA